MITCPNCNHVNPESATQCEACYTPLPSTTSCPNCGAEVQTDATFCGQCGFNLQPEGEELDAETQEFELDPEGVSGTLITEPTAEIGGITEEEEEEEMVTPIPEVEVSQPSEPVLTPIPEVEVSQPSGPVLTPIPEVEVSQPIPVVAKSPVVSSTQLQIQNASLLHLQTQTNLELPSNLTVIHIGKPNEQIPPDIDVSGFPDSSVVSRIHADIRVEGDLYFLEDVGSSNGTYVNHSPLPQGNRHRLRAGDRVSLGKGDLVTFIFQLS